MAKHRVTWFVLADGSRARFITRRAEGAGYDIVGDYESPEAHLATHEIMSDRPGRTFVHGVAGHLNAANARGDFDALVIYAAPRALAELRASLDEPTQQKIKAEVAKDLTKVPVVELPEHFAKVG
jgi:protein required for attachment to host cells